MVLKIITWVDLQGRYRVTSPAYNDATRPAGETEDECLERVWARLVAVGGYGIPIDHPHHYVENEDQKTKVAECCGSDFRYAGKPDANGKRSAIDGAWEMDTDGTPKVNMPKARGVHMDRIRVVRNAELVKKDLISLRAIEAGDTSSQAAIATEKQVLRDIPQTFDLTTDTPVQLQAKWPSELPDRE
jgi:uncharacterized Zn-finger protein